MTRGLDVVSLVNVSGSVIFHHGRRPAPATECAGPSSRSRKMRGATDFATIDFGAAQSASSSRRRGLRGGGGVARSGGGAVQRRWRRLRRWRGGCGCRVPSVVGGGGGGGRGADDAASRVTEVRRRMDDA